MRNDIKVPVDVKRTRCPSLLNTNDKGVLPVTVLATATFDVTQVNALGSVADNDCIVVKLKGKRFDGWPIVGEDVVLIKKKK